MFALSFLRTDRSVWRALIDLAMFQTMVEVYCGLACLSFMQPANCNHYDCDHKHFGGFSKF